MFVLVCRVTVVSKPRCARTDVQPVQPVEVLTAILAEMAIMHQEQATVHQDQLQWLQN